MQGNKTHEQQKRMFERKENQQGLADLGPAQPLEVEKFDGPVYDNSTGDRSIKRGANQASEHHKERQDD